MHPLSPRATELIAGLHNEPSVAQRVLGTRATADVAALEELAALAEPAAVPQILDLVFAPRGPIARVAAHALDRSLAAAAADDFFALDERCRLESSRYYYAGPMSPYAALRPAEVSRFATLGDAEVAVVGVASFHRDGHVREAAVTQLDAIGGAGGGSDARPGRELPFLLVRINDWVAPVAERARAAVERRLVPEYTAALVDALPFFLRLQLRTRRDHRALFDRVRALLRTDAGDDGGAVRTRGLASPERAVRRHAFRLAREASRNDGAAASGADRARLLRRALSDPDTVVRLEAVADARQRAHEGADGGAIDAAALAAILADPYPSVRREGLALAVAALGDGATPSLVAALLDRNQVVREVARFLLTRRGAGIDFAAHYGERLTSATPVAPHELAAALAGLGETAGPGQGSVEASAIVVPFLAHERPSVRTAAVRALAALDGDTDGSLAHLVAALHDPSPGVSRAARLAFRPRAPRVGLDALRAVLRDAERPHARLAAVSLGASLGKWDSLPILLEAAAHTADAAVADAARRAITAWVARQNQTFTPPSAAQLRAIAAALDDYHRAVDRTLVRELRAVLRSWESVA